MNILLLSNLYPPNHNGGYGSQAGLFCEGLLERGHSINVLTSDIGSDVDSRADLSAPANLKIHRVLKYIDTKCGIVELQKLNIFNFKSVKRLIKESQPDIIIVFGNDGLGFNVHEAVIQSGTASVTWLGDTWLSQAWSDLSLYDRWIGIANSGYNTGLKGKPKILYSLWGRMNGLYVGRKPSKYRPVCAISNFVREKFINSGAPVCGDINIVPIILDDLFFDDRKKPIGHSGIRSECLKTLFVSRIEHLKGPDTAIRGVADAISRGAKVSLTMAGFQASSMRMELENLAESLGVKSNICWAGTPTTQELIDLYRSHDIFLFPSRINEGLGVVNCEALACGLPIIGTTHSGSADVIIEGVTGFSFNKDDSQKLGERIYYFTLNRDKLLEMSNNAVEFAIKFRKDKIIDVFELEIESSMLGNS